MGKESSVSWLIKTGEDKFEIWTDQEYTMRKQKREYYGSKPGWVEVRKIDASLTQNAYQKPVLSTVDQLILDLALGR